MQSIEEVNAHLEKNSAKVKKAAKNGDAKTVWIIVKPFLSLMSTSKLVPQKVREGLLILITLLEAQLEQ